MNAMIGEMFGGEPDQYKAGLCFHWFCPVVQDLICDFNKN